jgi:hypothetical protein
MTRVDTAEFPAWDSSRVRRSDCTESASEKKTRMRPVDHYVSRVYRQEAPLFPVAGAVCRDLVGRCWTGWSRSPFATEGPSSVCADYCRSESIRLAVAHYTGDIGR